MSRIATFVLACLAAATVQLTGQEPGDTVVRLATTPRYPGIATLVPEISIGMANGPPEYTFTRIQTIVMVPDGSVIIADVPVGAGGRGNVASATIRWYGADGRYIRAVGRGGQGPGEYLRPEIARHPDGRLLVRDGRLHRINVYSPAGEPVTTWRIDEATNSSSGGDGLIVDRAGFVYLRISERPRLRPGGGLIIPLPTDDRLVRLRTNGSVIDTLAPPRLPDVMLPYLQAGRARSVSYLVPYTPWSTWSWSPLGYFVTAVTGNYAIDLRIPQPAAPGSPRPPAWRPGDRVVSIRRQVASVPVVDVERAARRAQIERGMRRIDPAWRWSGPDVPRVKPPLRNVLIGGDGRLWADVSLPSEPFTPPPGTSPDYEESVPFRQPTIYEVFEPDGTYLGRVGLPHGARILAMSGDIVWGYTTDADDVPTARRYRIAWR